MESASLPQHICIKPTSCSDFLNYCWRGEFIKSLVVPAYCSLRGIEDNLTAPCPILFKKMSTVVQLSNFFFRNGYFYFSLLFLE